MPLDHLLRTLLEAAIAAQFLLFAAYLLIGVSERRPVHVALAGLSIAIGGASLINTLAFTGGLQVLLPINLVLDLLISPAIYLIVVQSKEPASPLRSSHALHAAPAMAGLLIWLSTAPVSLNLFILSVHTAYLAAAIARLGGERACFPDKAVRHFLYMMTGYLAAFTGVRLAILAEVWLGGVSFQEGWAYSLILLLLLSLSARLVFQVLSNPAMLLRSQAFTKYAGSDLAPGEAELILQRLDQLFSHERLHADPDLSLEQLARRVGASPRHVSQAVNDHFALNVPTLINDRRVLDAARQLIEDRELPVTTIMFDCGFGSKTSFLRAFKRRFGLTPSEYRDQTLPDE